MTSGGAIGMMMRTQDSYPGHAASTLNVDWMRFRLYLKPSQSPHIPVANFGSNVTSGSAPLTVCFTDGTQYSPTSWSWTFGDSNSSTQQHPVHTYAGSGHLHGGPDGDQQQRQQHVHEDQLHHRLGRRVGPGGELHRQSDQRRGSVDGNLHGYLDQQPDLLVVDLRGQQHLDRRTTRAIPTAAAGSYTVALTATNQYGNNTNTKNNYITAGNAPVANFSGTPTSGAAPLAVTFTDSSTN